MAVLPPQRQEHRARCRAPLCGCFPDFSLAQGARGDWVVRPRSSGSGRAESALIEAGARGGTRDRTREHPTWCRRPAAARVPRSTATNPVLLTNSITRCFASVSSPEVKMTVRGLSAEKSLFLQSSQRQKSSRATRRKRRKDVKITLSNDSIIHGFQVSNKVRSRWRPFQAGLGPSARCQHVHSHEHRKPAEMFSGFLSRQRYNRHS